MRPALVLETSPAGNPGDHAWHPRDGGTVSRRGVTPHAKQARRDRRLRDTSRTGAASATVHEVRTPDDLRETLVKMPPSAAGASCRGHRRRPGPRGRAP